MRLLRRVIAGVAMLGVHALSVAAQVPGRPGTIILTRPTATLRGTVRDLGGQPVRDARVQVADLKRRTDTGPDGAFIMRSLPAGDTLLLIVARIGYRPMQLEVVLVPGENELTVDLENIAQQLDAVRTTAEQSGVFGVVGDTAYDVIAGADVRLTAGTDGDRTSNALGQFAFEDVKSGANFIEVRKPGYKPRLISFMQPPKGGTKLAIWMTPLPPGSSPKLSEFDNRLVQGLFDYRARARYKNNGAAIITRDMLAKYGIGMRLGDAIDAMPGAVNKGARSTNEWNVTVDEIAMQGVQLNDFQADNVEMVELYPPGTNLADAMRAGVGMRRTSPPTSISSARGAGAGARGLGPPPWTARVWLRR